jgi:NADH-quinone oxidoreductase subunit J
MSQVLQHGFSVSGEGSQQITVSDIGRNMLGTGGGGYALPFEVISMLLLAAMVGCIVIALRSKPETT